MNNSFGYHLQMHNDTNASVAITGASIQYYGAYWSPEDKIYAYIYIYCDPLLNPTNAMSDRKPSLIKSVAVIVWNRRLLHVQHNFTHSWAKGPAWRELCEIWIATYNPYFRNTFQNHTRKCRSFDQALICWVIVENCAKNTQLDK